MSAGGSLTAERVKELEELRMKFGLSKESAQKIIKGAQNQQLISNMNVSLKSRIKHTSLPSLSSSNLPASIRGLAIERLQV